jgi:DnaJ-class molecular chaperone
VLSDPEKRAAYDRLGEAGVGDTPLMDPATLFGVLFGSDQFEEYVGQLQMASAAGMAVEGGGAGFSGGQQEMQARLAAEQKVLFPLSRNANE